jgi:hypothetical protein
MPSAARVDGLERCSHRPAGKVQSPRLLEHGDVLRRCLPVEIETCWYQALSGPDRGEVLPIVAVPRAASRYTSTDNGL